MPTGSIPAISVVMGWTHEIKPVRGLSALDVGVGFGRTGFLWREVMEVRGRRYRSEDWITRMDGVEVWSKYRTPVWEFVYDTLFIGDARTIVPRLETYDVVYLLDVIEHMPKEDGQALLEAVVSKARHWVAVTFPNSRGHRQGKALRQGEYNGNPYEAHVSAWDVADFTRLGYTVSSNVGPNIVRVEGRGS